MSNTQSASHAAQETKVILPKEFCSTCPQGKAVALIAQSGVSMKEL